MYQNIIEEEDENDIEEDELEEHKSETNMDNGEANEPSLPSARDQPIPTQRSVPQVRAQSHLYEIQNRLHQRNKRKERYDPARDSTLRGKIRGFMNEVFKIMQGYFNQLVNISIVHINKLVLLFLFLVSVSRPTLINVILFIMFLILSMVHHQNEYRYLRLTLFLNSSAIVILYTFDVFIQRDFSTVRTWALIVIGVQYRRENVPSHLVKLKYIPYIILQVILVLSAYIF